MKGVSIGYRAELSNDDTHLYFFGAKPAQQWSHDMKMWRWSNVDIYLFCAMICFASDMVAMMNKLIDDRLEILVKNWRSGVDWACLKKSFAALYCIFWVLQWACWYRKAHLIFINYKSAFILSPFQAFMSIIIFIKYAKESRYFYCHSSNYILHFLFFLIYSYLPSTHKPSDVYNQSTVYNVQCLCWFCLHRLQWWHVTT